MRYRIIEVEQRSPEWHSFRGCHVMASDCPIIMGVSPWSNIHKLWLEKTNIEAPSDYISPRMQRGIDLEPKALKSFEDYIGIKFRPVVVKSTIHSFMGASLDGLSECGQYLVEIKCPGMEDHLTAISGKVPEKYYPQIQHQLAVTGLEFAYYFSFDGEDGIYLKVDRDEAYIDDLIEKERVFWDSVINYEEPKYKYKDYQIIEEEKCIQLATKLQTVSAQIAELEKEEKAMKDALISHCNEKNSIVGSLCLKFIERTGTIDYTKMLADLGICPDEETLSKYRRSSTRYCKVEKVGD